VAVEACFRFISADGAADGLLQALRREMFVTGSDLERVDGWIVADAALIEVAVVLKYPSLRLRTHGPHDGKREGVSAVGDGVDAMAVFCNHGIYISILAEGEAGMGGKDLVVRRQLHGMGHRCSGLREGLFFMTGGAVGILLAGTRLCPRCGTHGYEKTEREQETTGPQQVLLLVVKSTDRGGVRAGHLRSVP